MEYVRNLCNCNCYTLSCSSGLKWALFLFLVGDFRVFEGEILEDGGGDKGVNRKRKNYSVNLAAMHATCESNYARLMQLFPDYETSNSREFHLQDGARVHIDVVERCRYTTLMRVQQRGSGNAWLLAPRFELRAYHDARMAEVTGFQAQHRVAARYDYPNQMMHSRDEKSQQNVFLAEWLSYCLQLGRSSVDVPIPVKGAVDAS